MVYSAPNVMDGGAGMEDGVAHGSTGRLEIAIDGGSTRLSQKLLKSFLLLVMADQTKRKGLIGFWRGPDAAKLGIPP